MSAAQPTVIATSIGFQPDGGDTWRIATVSSVGAVPEGWRASAPRPEMLPHFSIVLHRGGYPDGS